MIEKKYFFIINPIAGNGRGLAAWKKIRKTLQEQGISYTHKYTFPTQIFLIVAWWWIYSQALRGLEGSEIALAKSFPDPQAI